MYCLTHLLEITKELRRSCRVDVELVGVFDGLLEKLNAPRLDGGVELVLCGLLVVECSFRGGEYK